MQIADPFCHTLANDSCSLLVLSFHDGEEDIVIQLWFSVFSSSLRESFEMFPSANEPRDKLKIPVSYTHLRAHETRHDLVCRLLLEKKKTEREQPGIATPILKRANRSETAYSRE